MPWIRRRFLYDDIVGSDQIADDAVDTAQIADDAVENAQIGPLAVDTAEIALDAIDGTLIADDAVDTEHIADDALSADATGRALMEDGYFDKATATAKVAAAAVSASLLNPDNFGVAFGTIATGDVQTMNATPVELVAAPGAGNYIEVIRIHWFLDFATAAYDAAAAGDTLEAKYTNGAGAAVCDAVAGDAIGAAVADYHTLVSPVAEVIPVDNAAIVAHINTGEWYGAAGDSPLKYEVIYRIRAMDPTA